MALGGNNIWSPLYLSLVVHRADTAANVFYADEKWSDGVGFRMVTCSIS